MFIHPSRRGEYDEHSEVIYVLSSEDAEDGLIVPSPLIQVSFLQGAELLLSRRKTKDFTTK